MKFSLTSISATAFLFSCCAAFNSAQAQSPSSPVLVDISPCMNLSARNERYACYDKLEEAVRAAQRTASQVGSESRDVEPVAPPAQREQTSGAAPAAVQTAPTSVAEFGQQTPSAAESAKVTANQQGDEELHDRITNVQEREPGRRLITLESGQVWYQSNSERFRLVKGMAVRIYPSPLRGSYRLARDDGKETGFIQVERVK